MTRHFCTLAVALLLLVHKSVAATDDGQTELANGTRFLVGFIHPDRAPGEPLPDSAYRVLVYASKGASITVDGRMITIDPGATAEVKLPVSTVVDIRSDRPVSVWSRQAMNGNGEQSLHLPVASWGAEYRAFAWWNDRHGLDSLSMKYSSAKRLIIAAYDSTRVSVETCDGTIDTILNADEWWLVSERIDTATLRSADSDPTGLLISATHPIGVVSGHAKAGVLAYPDGLPMTGPYARPANRCRGNLHDAMLPTSMAGTEFVTVPMSYTPTRERGLDLRDQGIGDDRGDVIRFVALSDSTVISRVDSTGNTVPMCVLKKGASWMDTRFEHATVWRSSQPVLCAHYGKSYGHITSQTTRPEDDPSTDAGMPLLMTVPGVDRWVTSAHVTAYAETYNAVSLVARTEDLPAIRMGNNRVGSIARANAIPGTSYSYVRITLPQGAQTFSSDSGKMFICWTYGSLDGYQLGRIYGSLASVDTRQPCIDSVDVSVNYSADSATVRGSTIRVGDACSKIAMLYLDNSVNLVSELKDDVLTIRRIDAGVAGRGRAVGVSTSGRTAARVIEFTSTSVAAGTEIGRLEARYSSASGTVLISGINATELCRLSIFTSRGQRVHESFVCGDHVELPLHDLATGLYVVVVNNYVAPLTIL